MSGQFLVLVISTAMWNGITDTIVTIHGDGYIMALLLCSLVSYCTTCSIINVLDSKHIIKQY